MDPATPLTIGLVATIAGVVGALGVCVLVAARWVRGSVDGLKSTMDTQFKTLQADIDTEFKDLRSDMDTRFDRLAGRHEALAHSHAEHKVHVAENYMSKASANLVFEKLGAQIGEMGAKMESRLMRIEDKVDRRSTPVE